MVKISEAFRHRIKELFPKLEDELRMAQMRETPDGFVKKSMILSVIFSLIVLVVFFIALYKTKIAFFAVIAFLLSLIFLLLLFLQLPKINIAKVRHDIEADIFVPSRMLITLLESGNSIVTALERVSYTNAKSSKYFGKIASEINLGKSLPEAIDEAMIYTPSESFKRFLQPIRKSLKAGTNIQENLNAVLDDLVKEKVIEIERYENRLGALSLFYMIFGVIIPAVSVVGIIIVMSVMGLTVNFFPFLFILLLILAITQFGFIKLFQAIRPLMRTS